MRGRRGLTVIELLVASGMFLMLTAVLFAVFRVGANSWLKGDAQSEIISKLQVVTEKLELEVTRASSASLSISPDAKALAFLTANDTDGRFHYDPVEKSALWQRYLVFHYSESSQNLLMDEVGVVGTAQEKTPIPIEDFEGRNMSDYFGSGKIVERELSGCEFEMLSQQLVRVTLSARKKRYGRTDEETFQTETVLQLRN